jgi:hypothetical protein
MLADGQRIIAATVWTGPLFTYSQPAPNPAQATNQDRITPDVWLTRAASKGVFNAFSETNATTLSPTNTEWAFGSLTNHASLGYTNWLALLNGASPTTLVGRPIVVHLISDDIYLSLNFTFWGVGGTGGFAYQRSTPPQPTIWNGPAISVSDAAQPDKITDNVWLARGSQEGLYNAATETGFTHFLSPADTEWADGTTANPNLTSLPYTDWNTWAKNIHGGPPNTVGVNAVVHLISDDIYIDIAFTSWSTGGAYSYQRSTPAVVLPLPTVTITNPVTGSVFAAPATLRLGADASVSGGTVTNVQFFSNGILLGSGLAAPFNFTAGNLPAGAYAFNAVATAAGISATSSVVNVSVVNPVTVDLSATKLNSGQFSFSYTANAGLAYVVQSSSNLVNWVSLSTNVAPGNPALFTNAVNSTGARFYRIGRLPNP